MRDQVLKHLLPRRLLQNPPRINLVAAFVMATAAGGHMPTMLDVQGKQVLTEPVNGNNTA